MYYLPNQPVRMIPIYKPVNQVRILSQAEDYNIQLLNIPNAWVSSKGEDVRVAILDTGCPQHVDIHPSGHESFITGYTFDTAGHSTHVGSLIAAIADNGQGITGVAPACEDYYGAVLDGNGSGTVDSIIAGIRWAVDTVGAHVINMSLGLPGGYPVSRDLERACNYAVDRGCTVFAAAGNEAASIGQPAIYDSVIAVGAIDKNKAHPNFSNVGPELDFVAGGVDVYGCYLNNTYTLMSGSSMSTPILSAVAALIIGKHLKEGKKLTPAEVKEHLQRISIDVGTVGPDPKFGMGIPFFSRPDWDSETSNTTNPAVSPPNIINKTSFWGWLYRRITSK